MRKFLRRCLTILVVLLSAIIVARFLFPLPDISDRPESRAFPASIETNLGRLIAAARDDSPDKTGVLPLAQGHDALASRLALINAAEQSVDAQYYIWHDDTSGLLLLNALHDAAERGVRVRLLLDDNGIAGLDDTVAALNAHENFQIRLFNPSPIRNPKALGYTFDFFRMNRRMHNKALLVDGAVAIIGGRNIGDEYFEVVQDNFYVDMDVLAAGSVVSETALVFDQYWNSLSVYEAENVISTEGSLQAFRERSDRVRNSDEASVFLDTDESSAAKVLNNTAELEWTNVRLYVDDPSKGLGNASRDQMMINRLADVLGGVEDHLDLVSAYFVPAKQGTAFLSDLSESGKTVNILTNALNTTDVLMVHAGYSKYRRELLDAGVNLFEFRLRSAESRTQLIPLSGASLHAKTFAIDSKRVFIGSFNFDPRSARLNCEMGFLIESPTMASNVSAAFSDQIVTTSYQPELTPEDHMVWKERTEEGTTRIYQQEPGATVTQQVFLAILGVLPIEWLL